MFSLSLSLSCCRVASESLWIEPKGTAFRSGTSTHRRESELALASKKGRERCLYAPGANTEIPDGVCKQIVFVVHSANETRSINSVLVMQQSCPRARISRNNASKLVMTNSHRRDSTAAHSGSCSGVSMERDVASTVAFRRGGTVVWVQCCRL